MLELPGTLTWWGLSWRVRWPGSHFSSSSVRWSYVSARPPCESPEPQPRYFWHLSLPFSPDQLHTSLSIMQWEYIAWYFSLWKCYAWPWYWQSLRRRSCRLPWQAPSVSSLSSLSQSQLTCWSSHPPERRHTFNEVYTHKSICSVQGKKAIHSIQQLFDFCIFMGWNSSRRKQHWRCKFC